MLKRVLLAAVLCTTSVPVAAETLNNATVVSLSQAGLGDEAIVAKVKASPGRYDLSTDQIIALKKQGVSGPVIAAMIAAGNPASTAPTISLTSPDPMVPHPAGVYVLGGGATPQMTRIDATVSNQAKTGGLFGYALTGGLASMSVKAAIPGETARTTADSHRPTFYMFFDESNPDSAKVASFGSGTAAAITSPNEFTLISLTKKKGRREARVGSVNIGGAKSGVMDKDQLRFDYTNIRPGVYKVTPNAELVPGEYGFIYSIGQGPGGALSARIFDFSIK